MPVRFGPHVLDLGRVGSSLPDDVPRMIGQCRFVPIRAGHGSGAAKGTDDGSGPHSAEGQPKPDVALDGLMRLAIGGAVHRILEHCLSTMPSAVTHPTEAGTVHPSILDYRHG